MRKNKLTLVGLGISILLYFIIGLLNIDLFETVINAMWSLEVIEIDEFVIPLLIFIVFLFIDQSRKHEQYRIEAEKAKVYQAMLQANQHIFNNFLNKIEFYRLKSEETDNYTEEINSLFDKIIAGTLDQVKALSQLESINENSITNCYNPKPKQSKNTYSKTKSDILLPDS